MVSTETPIEMAKHSTLMVYRNLQRSHDVLLCYVQVIAGFHINHQIILMTSKKANLGALLTLSMHQLSVLDNAILLFPSSFLPPHSVLCRFFLDLKHPSPILHSFSRFALLPSISLSYFLVIPSHPSEGLWRTIGVL